MRQRLAGGQNDVWRQRDQFRGIFAIVFGIGYGKAIINPHIVALGPAQLLQPLLECREAYLVLLIVHGRGREHTDAPHRGRLLRARRERPRRGGAEQCDERAPLHVWMAPAWQEIIWRAAQRSLAVMCPACWCSPGGLLALMGCANRVLIIRTGSMSR